MAGVSGSTRSRAGAVTPSARNEPAWMSGSDGPTASNIACASPAMTADCAAGGPRNGTGTMSMPVIMRSSSPHRWVICPGRARGQVDLPGISLSIGNEFGDVFGRERRIDLEHEGRVVDARDRNNVARDGDRVLLIKCHVDRMRASDLKDAHGRTWR